MNIPLHQSCINQLIDKIQNSHVCYACSFHNLGLSYSKVRSIVIFFLLFSFNCLFIRLALLILAFLSRTRLFFSRLFILFTSIALFLFGTFLIFVVFLRFSLLGICFLCFFGSSLLLWTDLLTFFYVWWYLSFSWIFRSTNTCIL